MSASSLHDNENSLDLLMARQSVYSKSQDIVAFELLFRSDDDVSKIKDDVATLDVVMNTYASIGSEKGVQILPCYLKVTEKVLLDDNLPNLPATRFSFEILGRTEITPELIARIRELVKEGYHFVLADYDPEDRRFDTLLGVVHVVKLDIQLLGIDRLPAIINTLRPYQLDLLADKVETKDEFRQCLEMGFSLYQGYFLSRPEPVKGKKISGNKMVLLQLLRELDNENASGATLEQIAANDPALAFKILKVVNSAAFRVPKGIESLSHAITLLGMDQMRRWVLLFLTAGDEGKPSPLTHEMLARGRMCELLADMQDHKDGMSYFIVGLLSQLDALFNIELAELLEQVGLSQELKDAILRHEGTQGEVLKNVELYGEGKFSELQGSLDKPFYEVAYRHSLKWADQVVQALGG